MRVLRVLKLPMFITALAVCMATTRAQELRSGPSVSVSLMGKTTMAGGPVIARVKLTNNSDFRIHIRQYRPQFLKDAREWVLLDLKDKDGGPVYQLGKAGHKPPIRTGFEWYLDAKQSLDMEIPAGASVTPPRAGEFTLVAQVKLRYRLLDSGGDPVTYLPLDVIQRIPMAVMPESDKALRGLGGDLVARLTAHKSSYEDNERAIIALLSIRESVGLPIWRSLLAKVTADRTTQGQILEQVARLNSATAVNLLSEVWLNSHDPDNATCARTRLLETHREGSPLLRPMIERRFIEAEGKFTPLEPEPKYVWDPGGVDKP